MDNVTFVIIFQILSIVKAKLKLLSGMQNCEIQTHVITSYHNLNQVSALYSKQIDSIEIILFC